MFEFKTLSIDTLKYCLNDLISLDKKAFQNLSWDENSFFFQLPGKFDNSFIVYKNKKIIAFCINSIKEDSLYIHRIVVDSKYKNNGIGSKMIYFLLNDMSHQKITLKVNVNNIFAINFYFKHNFKIINLDHEYYLMKRE
jgi:ribosomal protein S18 acetylase RimI-like enzyme